MKTPRIEEMVNGYTKEAMLFKVGEGEMERHQRLQNYVVEALTQAHQAGIDEGKFQERVMWERYQDEVESIFDWLQGENGDFPDLSQKPHYSFRSQLRTMRKAPDDIIKALKTTR